MTMQYITCTSYSNCFADFYLYAKNAKDDEKCGSYKHDVSNWF